MSTVVSKDKAMGLLQKAIKRISEIKELHVVEPKFTKWKRDTEVTIENVFSKDSRHLSDFINISYTPPPIQFLAAGQPTPKQNYRGYYLAGLNEAESILQSMLEEIEEFWEEKTITDKTSTTLSTTKIIELLCNRFHLVVRQLTKRHGGRKTLEVKDEYDVPDLMHSLLSLFFDDIRPEEWTPSYAGKSARVDFLLKVEKTVLEMKHSRVGLTEKELGDELIIDIGRYKATHPDCESLYCFVYDPQGSINNPRGIENDLSKEIGGMPVRVIIAPKIY